MNLQNEQLRLVQIEKKLTRYKLCKENNEVKQQMLQNRLNRLDEIENQLLTGLGD